MPLRKKRKRKRKNIPRIQCHMLMKFMHLHVHVKVALVVRFPLQLLVLLAPSRWLSVIFYWGVRWCISRRFLVELAAPPLCIPSSKNSCECILDMRRKKTNLIRDQMVSTEPSRKLLDCYMCVSCCWNHTLQVYGLSMLQDETSQPQNQNGKHGRREVSHNTWNKFKHF